MKTAKGLEAQLSGLPKLDLSALRNQYQKLYGKSAPRMLPREFIQVAVAYRLQKLLSARLRSKMNQALTAGELLVASLITNSASTELIKEWKGRIHCVTLLDDGVYFNGERFGTLSAVAHRITGKRISGPDFFGIGAERLPGTGAR